MNELQQVLLVFAVVVIAGLYFLSRSRQSAIKKHSKTSNSPASSQKASQELNDLGEPHIPVSQATIDRLNKPEVAVEAEQVEPIFNEDQAQLSFGEEFDLPVEETVQEKSPEGDPQKALKETAELVPEPAAKAGENRAVKQKSNGGKHHVLVVEDPGMTGEVIPEAEPVDIIPSFGIPEEKVGQSPGVSSGEKQDSEIFVIMVMSAGHEFAMTDLNQALLGVGLTFSDSGIYVKRDNMGNNIIRVANLLEPGIFPTEDLESYATAGVAMILELPTSVRAPAAMHDLIMMARKVSQRMQGRLYNMERHLIKESDLQSMRDAAVEYESQPL